MTLESVLEKMSNLRLQVKPGRVKLSVLVFRLRVKMADFAHFAPSPTQKRRREPHT